MNNKFSVFGLNIEQTEVLFALQRKITSNDAACENKKKPIFGSNKAGVKRLWLAAWKESIELYIQNLGGTEGQINLPDMELRQKIAELDKTTQNTVWKYMVLLECVLYHPYYPIDQDKEAYKPFKGLSLDKKSRKESLLAIADLLGVDSKYINIFEKSHSKAIKSLSGYWTKVFAGAVIGIVVIFIAICTFQYEIVAFFAAEGLSGAAAISAGLAALGGGAIAAGGFGMAGGLAVLIGGGALLGSSAGTAVGMSVASLGANAVMSEAAKLQVVLKEIVLAIQKDTDYFQKILMNISGQIKLLNDEIIKLRVESEKNKKKIKNLEESVNILEKLIKTAGN